MLLGNYSVIHKSPGKFFGGTTVSNVSANFQKNGQLRAIYSAESVPDQWGLPVGYYSGWMLPRKAGYVVAYSDNQVSSTANPVMGVNGNGTCGITLTALGDLSLVVSATGTCDIIVTATGELIGSIYGAGTSAITLSATGTIGANAFGTGTSTITLDGNADISALGFMTGSMNPFTELSPEGLAKAVWSALASENNIANTMGAKLNTASSGGVDLNALAQAVWEYTMRSLTESAGLSTEEHDKLMSISNGGGGGFVNYEAINSHTTRKVNEIKETIEKQPNYTEKLNEIDSHIELAKETVIDTIEEVETEVCSDIIRKTDELKKDNVTTRNLVRQKTKKIDENVSKLADRQDLTDKMIEDEADELEEEIEQLYEKEADYLEKEIESKLNEEFDLIESEINQLTNGNT